MRTKNSLSLAVLILTAWLQNAGAGTVTKANNQNLLNDTGSWLGGSLPGSGDIATWDNNVTAANSVGLGAPATWSGIALNNPGGLVTITNDGNTLTIGASGIDLSVTNNGLTLNCPLNISANQVWTVTNSRTLTVNGPVTENSAGLGITKNGNGGVTLSGTNNFSGPITLNAGTITLASSNAWPGAASLIFNGGTLAINAGVTVTNLSVVTSNTTASANVSCSGVLPNNITINPGTNNIPPTASGIYSIPPSGFVQVNLSGSVSPGGYITNYGVLNLSGSGTQNIGTIIGAGSESAGTLGGVQDNNTNSTGKTLLFGNGSAFSYFKPGAASRATLQVVNNGTVYFKWFGYNDTAGMVPYTNTLNGGTWIIGQMGQNNSGTHYVGQLNITGGAAVTVTNQNGGSGPGPAFSHGTYNIIDGTMTFNAAVAEGHAANNFGLNIFANNSGGGPGIFTITNGGMTLGFPASFPNSAQVTNSLNVGTGGAANITGNLTVGTTQAQSNPETNAVNLSGGKLVVNGTFQAAAVVSGQDRVFNWTGGQLTAATITTNSGFNDAASLLNSTTLTNNAGTLSPGDDGIPGRTIVNGSYVQKNGGTVAIDLGGTTRAPSFQASTNGFYDYVQVNGNMTLGGSLKIKLVGGYAPAYTDQLNILSTSGAGNIISGTFTNIIPGGGGLGLVPVDGMTNTYFRAIINSQTNTLYLINYTNIATSSGVAPTNVLAQIVNLSGTNNIVITGSGGSGSSGYSVLSATNLTPPINWITNAIAMPFGAGGSVNFTNLIDPAMPQEFYRIRVP